MKIRRKRAKLDTRMPPSDQTIQSRTTGSQFCGQSLQIRARHPYLVVTSFFALTAQTSVTTDADQLPTSSFPSAICLRIPNERIIAKASVARIFQRSCLPTILSECRNMYSFRLHERFALGTG